MPLESHLPEAVVISVVEPPQTNHKILHKLKQLAVAKHANVAAGVQGIAASIDRAWEAFKEEQPENIPPPRNDFIITGLLAFAAIKAQGGDQGFPFHTHAKSVNLSLISLLLYGFASAAESRLMVSVRYRNSTHRAIARLGRIVSMGLLVGSLTFVFFS